jgi:hypothetical protein
MRNKKNLTCNDSELEVKSNGCKVVKLVVVLPEENLREAVPE